MNRMAIGTEVLIYLADEENFYAGLRFVQSNQTEQIPSGVSIVGTFSPLGGKVPDLSSYPEVQLTVGDRKLRNLEEHPDYDQFKIVGVHVSATLDTRKGLADIKSRVITQYGDDVIKSFVRLAMDYDTRNNRQQKALDDYFKNSDANKHFSVRSIDQVNKERAEASANRKVVKRNPLTDAVRGAMHKR